MVTTLERSCPGCGRERRHEQALCDLCGHLFAPGEGAALPLVETALPPAPPTSEPAPGDHRKALAFALVGLAVAPLVTGVPFLRQMHWFLGAIVHEMGHTFVSLLLGRPAFPALSLSGHAVTITQERSLLLAGLTFALLVAAALRLRRPLGPALAAAVVVLHPLLVLHDAAELLILVGGHLAELAFAALALHRALTGGFTHSHAERALYSVVGWAFLADNLRLTLGLLFQASARAEYAASGSYGLTNDYLVVAREFTGGGLSPVVLAMSLVALGVPPLVYALARRDLAADG